MAASIASTAVPTKDLPTLVFVPGSWHRPSCYDKVIKLLEAHRLRCVAVSLASTSGDRNATLKDDIDIVQAAIAHETRAGKDVVVVVHSYGGIVGGSAIKGFARSGASAAPDTGTGAVIGLVLMASGFVLGGLAFMDPFFGHPPPGWRVNRETGFADLVTPPREFFYHDLSEDEARYWTAQLTPQSLRSLFEGAEHTYSGWLDVPSWYIGTIDDHALPVAAQRIQVGMARAMGGRIEHRELPTSHSPFLSRPEETADLVLEAVGAFTGAPLPAVDLSIRRQRPQVALFRPITWYRFGIALALGHFVGKSIVLFGWGRRLWKSVFGAR